MANDITHETITFLIDASFTANVKKQVVEIRMLNLVNCI